LQIHFVFLYREDAPPGSAGVPASPHQAQYQQPQLHAHRQHAAAAPAAAPRRVSPLLLVLLAYLAWMCYVAVNNNWGLIRRVLRRQLGLRL